MRRIKPFKSIFIFIAIIHAIGCAHTSKEMSDTPKAVRSGESTAIEHTSLTEPRYTYHEFDMICVFFETEDLDLYQNLLPPQFSMPAKPLVFVFFADYYKMDRATQPYREAAVFLLVDYEGQMAWHCVTMPVTSDEARLGGIYYLGYPKIMADISFQRSCSRYMGTLKLKGNTVLSAVLNTDHHEISAEEREVFERLKGLPNFTIKNGAVFRPKFGDSDPRYNLLQLAGMYPEKIEVVVGETVLRMDTDAATAFSDRLGSIFSIRPSETILSYYLKNKFVMRFKN